MKKIFAILCATVALFSCSQSDVLEIEKTQDQTPQGTPVNFNITVEDEGATKARKTSWATGDVIYIKFKGIDTKFMTITYNASTSTWTPRAYTLPTSGTPASTTFETSDFSGISDADRKLGAMHFPIAVNAKYNRVLNSDYLALQTNNTYTYSYYMYQSEAVYTFDGTDVNITLSLKKPAENVVLFHIDGIQANAEDYSLKIIGTDTETYRCTSRGIKFDGTIGIARVGGENLAVQGIPDSDGAIFAVWLYSGFDSAKELTFTVIGPDCDYTISGNMKLNAGYQYSLPALNSSKWSLQNCGFSVSSTQKVLFSPGNLQYQASTGTWRFAEHQWESIKDAAGNTTTSGRDTQANWIDLFGWGTSGYNHGATNYQPWQSENDASKYYAYGDYSKNLYDGDGKADWGYNAISNGGNEENSGWRTPKNDEWNYLLYTRTASTVNNKSNARFTMAEINTDGAGVKGLIIFPDLYIGGTPTGVTWGTINAGISTYTNSTQCTTAGWAALEAAGCVFLPVTGYRSVNVIYSPERGMYWSSDSYQSSDKRYSYDMKFSTEGSIVGSGYSYYRHSGMAVRLVKNK